VGSFSPKHWKQQKAGLWYMNNGNTNENFSIQAKLFIDEAVFVSVSSKIQLPYPLYLLFFVQLLLRKCVYCVAVCDVKSFLCFMLLSLQKSLLCAVADFWSSRRLWSRTRQFVMSNHASFVLAKMFALCCQTSEATRGECEAEGWNEIESCWLLLSRV
jgi:hypothetical protein